MTNQPAVTDIRMFVHMIEILIASGTSRDFGRAVDVP